MIVLDAELYQERVTLEDLDFPVLCSFREAITEAPCDLEAKWSVWCTACLRIAALACNHHAAQMRAHPEIETEHPKESGGCGTKSTVGKLMKIRPL